MEGQEEVSAPVGTGQGVAPPTGVGAPPAAASGEAAPWYNGFSPEHQEIVQSKKWQGPEDVVKGYANAEKLLGVSPDQILRVPKEGDTDGWNAVYDRLGRPGSPDGYDISAPEGMADISGWAKPVFHRLGLTAAQATTLTNEFNQFQASQLEDMQNEKAIQADAQEKALQREWGSAFEANINVAKRAATAFGISVEQIDALQDALGFDGVMKFLNNVGSKLGEGSYVDGEGGGDGFSNAMTPAQAQKELGTLMNDKEFMAAWLDKSHPKHKETMAKKTQLTEYAYPVR